MGSGPPARPPRELLGRRRPNRPQEPTSKLEPGGLRRLGRSLDKPPGCRGPIPLDPQRAGHRCDSQLAEIHPRRSIGEDAFRLSLPLAERALRLFGGSSHRRCQDGIARGPTEGEDGHIATWNDIYGAPWTPHLNEPGIPPGGRRYVLYARVERQHRGSRSAVLKSRERGIDETSRR